LVTGQALAVLHLDRRAPGLREADDEALVVGVLRVRRARAVAGLAHARLAVVLRVRAEDLRVRRVLEVIGLLAVALDADLLADVGGGWGGGRGLAGRPAREQGEQRRRGRDERARPARLGRGLHVNAPPP